MILVPDLTRKFPLVEVPYLEFGTDDLFEFMLSVKQANCPDWTDESASDLGIQLLWMYAVLSGFMVKHMERAKNNCFVGTAQDRESMRRITELIGYTLSEASPASVELKLTHTASHGAFVIPKGNRFSTKTVSGVDAVIFETIQDENVGVDQAISLITCHQGTTTSNKVIGSSDGTANQRFPLNANNIIWKSESIQVFSGTWQTWTRVDNFVDSGTSDKHYRIEIVDENKYTILFSDGVIGVIPTTGTNNIRATFRIGLSQLGNVGATTITQMVDAVPNTTAVINEKAATGGIGRESLDRARIYSTANVRTLDRAVTLQDVETLSKSYTSTNYGGIAQCKAFNVGLSAIHVMIVPMAGGLPITGHRSELQAYLAQRMVMGAIVQVINPKFVLVDITADVVSLPGTNAGQLANIISDRLVQLITPTFIDIETGIYPHEFGRDIRISDIYAVIDNTSGVDYTTVTAPTSSIIINQNEIADVGTITINVTTNNGDFTYTNLKDDVLRRFQKKVDPANS